MIRAATLSDAAALVELGRETFAGFFGPLYQPQYLAEYLDEYFNPARIAEELAQPELRIWVAEEDGALIGYAKAGPLSIPAGANADDIELQRLYVLREYHGQGVADGLMQCFMEYWRSCQAPCAYIGVWEENFRAQAFYKRYGFEHFACYYFTLGPHRDREFILKKALE